MNFSLVPARDLEEADEYDIIKYEKRNDPFVIKTRGGWRIYFNTLQSAIDHEGVATEFREALSLYKESAETRSVGKKDFLNRSERIDDIPLIQDPANNTQYLCSGITHARLGDIFNSSFHRIEKLGDNLMIFLGNGDLMKMVSQSPESGLNVFVSNPSSPEIAVASSLSVGYGTDEMLLAGAVSRKEGGELHFTGKDGLIPASSNFVIEGTIMREQESVMQKFRTPKGVIEKEIPYNLLSFRSILFDEKTAYGIIQGGTEHLALFDIARKVNPGINIDL